eukprot:g4902.t1
MLNFGITELRLVAPRDGWPNEHALKAASGAVELIEKAQLFDTVADAIADLDYVLATTARPRDMTKQVFTPEEGAGRLKRAMQAGGRPGVMFGAERAGLHNDDVALADAVITAALNPGFSSLNLGQAVLLLAYEWSQLTDKTPAEEMPMNGTRPATKKELQGFFEHLEVELDDTGFLLPLDKRPAMVRNLRNMFQRAALTEQEIRTLRGIAVGHGHILVNGKRVNIPSYRVKEGDVIEVKEKMRTNGKMLEAAGSPERDTPDYLDVDLEKFKATFVRTPVLADIPYPVQMEPNLVIEFYSR